MCRVDLDQESFARLDGLAHVLCRVEQGNLLPNPGQLGQGFGPFTVQLPFAPNLQGRLQVGGGLIEVGGAILPLQMGQRPGQVERSCGPPDGLCLATQLAQRTPAQ